MTWTNRNGLPLPIQLWIACKSDYDFTPDENTISTTTLLKSVRQIILGRRYKDSERVADFSDMTNLIMGSALHTSIERALEPERAKETAKELGYSESIIDKMVVEKRSTKEIEGFTISGKFDMVYDGTVCDIKSTKTWGYILGDGDAYTKQMSIYRWLNQDLITEDIGYIFYIFTDWDKTKSLRDTSYPQSQIASKKFGLMSVGDTEDYIRNKIQLIKSHELTPDNDLPLCTPEERWEKKPQWKYYKNPSKMERATKVYKEPREAYERSAKEGGIVIEIKGESTGCKYFSYSNLCNQYLDLQSKGLC
jgi:hypothetical protein